MRIAAVLTAAALTTTACGSSGSGDGGEDGGDVNLTMTWWGNDDRAQRYNEAIEAYEAENPGVSVTTSFVDYPNYWPARATEAAGRSLPDVMQMDVSYLRQFASNGQLLDFAEVEGDGVDLSGLPDPLIPSGQVEGAQYGIPVATNAFTLFTDAAGLAQVGVELPENPTWEEYHDFLREVATAGGTTEDGQPVYGAGDYTGVFWMFIHWLNQQGIEAFTEDGELGFTQDDLETWLSSVDDLRAEGLLIPPARINQLSPLSPFDAGETTSEMTWDNFAAGYATNNPDVELELQPIPSDDPENPGLFLKPSMLFSIGANTDHPEEAAALIDYLVNDPEVGDVFGTSQGLRASSFQRDAMTMEGLDAEVAAYEESIEPLLVDSPPPPVEGFGTIEARLLEITENINYGTVSVEDAAAQWYSEAEQTLADNQ
ncbi:ABC transporter substrate-binding protein [uncultured Pseudokineococcus sp.]|uniref:ABC transporter substrate-binding protein n=1 Tax=uncultured Pseudokineococcus sp. TaxID=1642928 RepID=UPI00262BF205|nr:extracellular solute-binding protein [uncultured Pseudokineococcus sp.]